MTTATPSGMKWRRNTPAVVPPANLVDNQVGRAPKKAIHATNQSPKAKQRWNTSLTQLGHQTETCENEVEPAYKRSSAGMVWRKNGNFFGFLAQHSTGATPHQLTSCMTEHCNAMPSRSMSAPENSGKSDMFLQAREAQRQGGCANSKSPLRSWAKRGSAPCDSQLSDVSDGHDSRPIPRNSSLTEVNQSTTSMTSVPGSRESLVPAGTDSSNGGSDPFAATHSAGSNSFHMLALNSLTTVIERRDLMATKPIGRRGLRGGHVFLARQVTGRSPGRRSSSQHRIVKVLRHGASAQALEAFRREIKILASLSHPNVVELVGTATSSYPMLSVYALCKYGDLETFLHRSNNHGLALRPQEQLVIVTQVASAMSHLESQRIVHMNLAAKNILVDERCTVKIADFSYARQLAEGTTKVTVRDGRAHSLNPRWLAPESLGGRLEFSSASDVWSFGVVAWEIFTGGAVPYSETSVSFLGHAVTKKRLRLSCPSGCPTDWYQLLMLGCWRTDAAQRPSFMCLAKNAAMIAAVHASLASSSTSGGEQEPIRNLGQELEARLQVELQINSNKTQLGTELTELTEFNELLVQCMGSSESSGRQHARPRFDTGSSIVSALSACSTLSISSTSSTGKQPAAADTFDNVVTSVNYEETGGVSPVQEDVYGTMRPLAAPECKVQGPAHIVDNTLCLELDENIYQTRMQVAPKNSSADNDASVIVPELAYIVNEPETVAADAGSAESTNTGAPLQTMQRQQHIGLLEPLKRRSGASTHPTHTAETRSLRKEPNRLHCIEKGIVAPLSG